MYFCGKNMEDRGFKNPRGRMGSGWRRCEFSQMLGRWEFDPKHSVPLSSSSQISNKVGVMVSSSCTKAQSAMAESMH